VREQEKQYAKVNRQAYEERLAQQRKTLYAELLQKWDRQHQQELLSLQNAHQRALDAASAAQVPHFLRFHASHQLRDLLK